MVLASTSNYISKLVIRYEQKLIELGTGILTTTKGPGHNSTLSDFIKMQVPNNMLSVSQKPQKKTTMVPSSSRYLNSSVFSHVYGIGVILKKS